MRLTAGTCAAMALLLALTGAFIYERMSFALNRSIGDVPATNRVEIDARERHRREALHELLVQLTLAYGGTVVISGVIGYRIARSAMQPVEAMRRQAAQASGAERLELPVAEIDDELSRLGSTLNDLLARVATGVDRERRLIADASHELRTPLALMLMQADLALSRTRTAAETTLALRRIRHETDRLIRLANGLLVVANADEQRPVARQRLPLAQAIRASLSRAEITAAIHGPVDAASVLADPGSLEQTLDNLIHNAVRHGQAPYEVLVDVTANEVTVHVLDRGPGFPDTFLERAFERFATASTGRSGRTAGLGLAIVDAAVTAGGGRAQAANRPGGGADVSITLPRAGAGHAAG